MSNYLPPTTKKTNTYCTVCNSISKLTALCVNCNNRVCMNNCSYMLLPQDIANKPWMSYAVGKNICLNCMPRIQTASENYIRKVFAEIFSADEDDSNVNFDETNVFNNDDENKSNLPSNNNEIINNLIGGAFSLLNKQGKINFTEDGQISQDTLENFTRILKSSLYNAEIN